MLKKIVFGALTLLLAICMVGCGGNKGGGADKKDTAAVEGTPDKAILAYAQLYAYGNPDEDAVKAAGLTEKEILDVQTTTLGGPMFAFANFSLSKPNLESIVNQYSENMKASTKVNATLKKDDKESPVVEITAATYKNDAESNKVGEEEINLLQKALDELKAQGLTDEQLVASEEYQAFALESLKKVIGSIQFNDAASIEVPCVIVEKDGKKYWAPKDVKAIENFFWTKK